MGADEPGVAALLQQPSADEAFYSGPDRRAAEPEFLLEVGDGRETSGPPASVRKMNFEVGHHLVYT